MVPKTFGMNILGVESLAWGAGDNLWELSAGFRSEGASVRNRIVNKVVKGSKSDAIAAIANISVRDFVARNKYPVFAIRFSSTSLSLSTSKHDLSPDRFLQNNASEKIISQQEIIDSVNSEPLMAKKYHIEDVFTEEFLWRVFVLKPATVPAL